MCCLELPAFRDLEQSNPTQRPESAACSKSAEHGRLKTHPCASQFPASTFLILVVKYQVYSYLGILPSRLPLTGFRRSVRALQILPPCMDPQEAAESSPTSPTSPSTPISPPFWHSEGQELPPPADISSRKPRSSGIQLEDHTHEDSEHSKACWAKSVAIRDHVVVGSGLGTYVVYNCVVETANVSAQDQHAVHTAQSMADFHFRGATLPFARGRTRTIPAPDRVLIASRYSEFDILRANLLHTFPNSEAALPKLPPKSAFGQRAVWDRE